MDVFCIPQGFLDFGSLSSPSPSRELEIPWWFLGLMNWQSGLEASYMGVSENSGTPKSSILRGFSIINHPFWGIPIFGKTHISPSHGFFSAKKHQQRRQGAEVGSNLRHSHGSKDIPQEKQGSLNGTPKHRSMVNLQGVLFTNLRHIHALIGLFA